MCSARQRGPADPVEDRQEASLRDSGPPAASAREAKPRGAGRQEASRQEASRHPACATVLLAHEIGLHARPSVRLTKLAKGFGARIELALAPEGPWVDAKSIVRVMAMRATRGALLHFRAEGADAEAAVGALVDLVARDFPEAPGRP